MKTTKLKDKIRRFRIVVDPNMPRFRDDAYFKKKAEKSKEFFLKHGLPKNWHELINNI